MAEDSTAEEPAALGITSFPISPAWYPCDMDTPTSRDLSRQVATGGDIDYTLSLEEVAQLYAKAGHPRTLRTLQRYSASGHLDAQKMATTLGDKYLVTPQSVARHIAQIEELGSVDPVATGRDTPRQVATAVAHQQSQKNEEPLPATGDDRPRQAATPEGESSRYVAQLEKRIEEKDVMINVLRGERHKFLNNLYKQSLN